MELDFLLNFDNQIKAMSMKAARQLNVLQRLSTFISEETRLLILKSILFNQILTIVPLYGISVARQIQRNWKNCNIEFS